MEVTQLQLGLQSVVQPVSTMLAVLMPLRLEPLVAAVLAVAPALAAPANQLVAATKPLLVLLVVKLQTLR